LDSLKNDTLLPYNLKIAKSGNSKDKTLHDYIFTDKVIRWTPIHSDTSSYLFEVMLRKFTVRYVYHGQCSYEYVSHLKSDTTVEVLWSYQSDCVLDMFFLKGSNSTERYPKLGNAFATLTLTNDTTLIAKYNFPDWIKKVNEIANDSIFSKYYYLIDRI
jgi:hypothetical protein